MTKIISILNHKGGVGKTTTTANVGAILARKGKKVLVVDLDPQTNLTTYFLKEEEIPERTIFEALKEEDGKLPIVNIGNNLDLVPSSLDMSTIDFFIMSSVDRNELLKMRLEEISSNYDFILLDCAPSLGIMTTNSLIASTDVIIPLIPEVIPVKGLKTITDFISTVQRRANKTLRLSGIVITRFDKRKTVNRDIEEGVRQTYGDIVFKTNIRENVTINEAPNERKDVVTYSPNSHGSEDYTSLTEEIFQL